MVRGAIGSRLSLPKKNRVTPIPGNPAVYSSPEETRGFPSPPRGGFSFVCICSEAQFLTNVNHNLQLINFQVDILAALVLNSGFFVGSEG